MIKILVISTTMQEGIEFILNELTLDRQVSKIYRDRIITNDGRHYSVVINEHGLRGHRADKVYLQESLVEELMDTARAATVVSDVVDKRFKVETFD